MRKKMILLSVIVLLVAFVSLSFKNDEPKFKNLKVLDKNISKDELTIIMKEFKTALGVKCNFCHVESKTNPGKLDFVSDDNKHKDIARNMMRMTKRINKKFFKDDGGNAVSCFTCHNGNKEPKEKPKEVLEDE
jgi:hypothetical protein